MSPVAVTGSDGWTSTGGDLLIDTVLMLLLASILI
jgi:hypothetical protein